MKVPEYAPWARHGFARMTAEYEKTQPYMDAPKDKYTQEEIDRAANALNAVINTMRPGNLPELARIGGYGRADATVRESQAAA